MRLGFSPCWRKQDPPLRSPGSVRFRRPPKIGGPSGWFRCSPTQLSTCGGVSASGSGRSAASIICRIQGPALGHPTLLVPWWPHRWATVCAESGKSRAYATRSADVSKIDKPGDVLGLRAAIAENTLRTCEAPTVSPRSLNPSQRCRGFACADPPTIRPKPRYQHNSIDVPM